MKKIVLFIFVTLTVCLVSCDRFRGDASDSEKENVASSEKQKDSIKASANNKQDEGAKKVDSLKIIIEEQKVELSNLKEGIKKLDSTMANVEERVNTHFLILSIVAVCLLLLNLYLYSKNKDFSRRAAGQAIRKLDDHRGNIQAHKVMLDNLKKDILKQIEGNKKYAPKDINNKNGQAAIVNQKPAKEEKPSQIISSEDKTPKVFYMPRTIKECEFEDAKKSLVKTEASFFKFTIDRRNPNKAKFVFDPYDSSYASRSFDDRDRSMITCCEIESISDSPTSCINVNNGEGEAELRNGIWYVTKKLKIKYV